MKVAGTIALASFFVALVITVGLYFVLGGEIPGPGYITIAVATSLFLTLTSWSFLRRRQQIMSGKMKPAQAPIQKNGK